MKGIVITQDKLVEEREVSTLEELQAVVDGFIEPVTLSDGSTMYVNEEGLFRPDCGFNSIASDVAGLGGRSDLAVHGVRGNVIVVGPVNGEGDSTDVTDTARRWIERVRREAQ